MSYIQQTLQTFSHVQLQETPSATPTGDDLMGRSTQKLCGGGSGASSCSSHGCTAKKFRFWSQKDLSEEHKPTSSGIGLHEVFRGKWANESSKPKKHVVNSRNLFELQHRPQEHQGKKNAESVEHLEKLNYRDR